MKKNILRSALAFSTALLISIIPTSAQSSTDLQQKVEEIVNSDALRDAVVGVCARKGDGQTLIDIASHDLMVPASNMKLISTGAALHALGGDYRYKTGIAYAGKIADGVLDGDLYIIGGGDPTIASKDSIASPVEHTFALWERMIRDAGINEVNGKVIGLSGDFFSGMNEEPSWMWSDIGTYYGAGVSGLMFYENMQSFEVAAGAQVGDAIKIKASYPQVPWMEFRYECSTGKAGSGDQLYMYTSDLAPVAEIRGTFAVDRKPKRVDCSNKFPELTCAHYFSKWLNEHGLKCSAEAGDDKLKGLARPDSLCIIGHTSSPTLRRIAFETNHASNNLYAETLLKTLGKELRNEGSYDSSYVAVKNVLEKIGVKTTSGFKLQDGSGLSRKNFISPDFFCRYLEAMMSSECFEDFVESLPSPGGTGTLASNMKEYPAEIKSRIKAKSGSMDGVRCYSGYIIPSEGCKDDTIVFSIMVNNCTAPTWKVRPMLDKIMGMLAESN